MISYAEAKEKIMSAVERLDVVLLPLSALNGRILAEPAIAPYDLPLFDQSAMDGYGVRFSDVESASEQRPVLLKLQKIIQAGDFCNEVLLPSHAVRIFTGAPIPPGVDAVVMQEFCNQQDNQVAIADALKLGENIRRRGEEFRQGSLILPAGTPVTPSVIGLLATLGYAEFPVYRAPKIALVITGNELVSPGQPLRPGQIYDSNAHALRAALEELRIPEVSIYYATDNPDETLARISEVLAAHDVIITVGGISVGDYDLVKGSLEKLNVKTVFWRIAIKPGKPVYFGIYQDVEQSEDRKLVFGLPGNPVSALVTFHQFVQPALLSMMGYPTAEETGTTAKLTHSVKSRIGRCDLVRAKLTKDRDVFTVSPTAGQDSHMLGGLALADCLIHVPEEAERLEAGQMVQVVPLNWQH